MLTLTLPSQYLTDRATQCFVNVKLALSKQQRRPGSCRIGQASCCFRASKSVSNHMEVLVRNSKVSDHMEVLVRSSKPTLVTDSPPAAEKMKQFLDLVNSSETVIQPWPLLLRMRDVLEATIACSCNRFPRTSIAVEPNSLPISQLQACTAIMEDNAAASLSPTEVEQLQCIFTTVLQYELALLAQAICERARQNKSRWHPSNILFTTDFDVTCTMVDSCYSLVQAARSAAVKRLTSGRNQSVSPDKLLEEYESILVRHAERTKATFLSFDAQGQDDVEVATYWREEQGKAAENDFLSGLDPSLKLIQNKFFTSLSDPTSEEKWESNIPYNDAGLRKALIKLAMLEVLCNEDIIRAGVLSGSTREEILVEAKKVLLRPNCAEFLQALVHIGTAIHIVSANWSRDLIIGGLPELPRDKLFVHCNDLLFDSAGVSEGIIDMTVVDAFDKEKTLLLLRKMNSRDQEEERMLVYLGDSHTDLLGLLEADLGIVIGESPLLRRVLTLYGVQLVPLAEAIPHVNVARLYGSQLSYRKTGILFAAQGWTEVETCLFGEQIPEDNNSSLVSLSSEIEKLIEQVQSSQQSYNGDDKPRDQIPPISLDMRKLSN